MDIYASDEEKGEEIKRWWRENGLSVVIGIALAAAALVGGRYWQTQQQVQAQTASQLYQQTAMLIDSGQVEQASATVDSLISQYGSTPYATFAALAMAKQNLAQAHNDTAKMYLEWVIANGKLAGQQDIARLRLAKIWASESAYSEAMAVLEQRQTVAFTSLFAETRGDILFAQKHYAEAREAYQQALDAITESEARQILLKLKLDNVAE